ncbi:hypothetical protein CK203_041223 [Vitis vinifera]|uniref:Retrotransposon Copia-like N-terminal domain-containing protein n=1 Tax=Vitis vinifera TaxID=29760 RepID=A0A438HT22_VITVI|nr:hypothetical protein CK203_041223 [Vitis vinifera]
MSEISESTPSITVGSNSSKLPTSNSHSHSVQITTIRLNENNFLRWSKFVRMYIRGRGKIGYLTGDTKEPVRTNPSYATWNAENSMIMAWLMYSNLVNQSQIYELQLKLGDICQGRIIGRQPLPSLGEVYSKVCCEESRKNVMLRKKLSGPMENSTLLGTAVATSRNPNNQCCPDDKPRLVEWKTNKQGNSNHFLAKTHAAKTPSLRKEQLDQLLQLLKLAPPTPSTPIASLAQLGFELMDDDWEC